MTVLRRIIDTIGAYAARTKAHLAYFGYLS